jgi:hypothetical protein
MQWSSGRPFVPPAVLDRLHLRRAAMRYAARGWTVMPGAYLRDGRFTCGRAGCRIAGCHPALESWQDEAVADARRVSAWWRHRPYQVLLATGRTFDVLEVPASVGLRALGATRLHTDVLGPDRADGRGPVAVGPTGRWMFFVRPGVPLRSELDNCLDVVRHGRGSWVPAAPSRMPEGAVRWATSPAKVHWRLPGSAPVQAMLVDALAALGRWPAKRPAEQPAAVPRQMSTSRRAV